MMSLPAERLDTTTRPDEQEGAAEPSRHNYVASARRTPPIDLLVETSDDETFLFAYVANLHELGVFVRTDRPLPIGTHLLLGFESSDLVLSGEVAWINPVRNDDNPNPGMGIRFVALDLEQRDHVVGLVRAIAYLDDPIDAN